jgi:hypothetical protein
MAIICRRNEIALSRLPSIFCRSVWATLVLMGDPPENPAAQAH